MKNICGYCISDQIKKYIGSDFCANGQDVVFVRERDGLRKYLDKCRPDAILWGEPDRDPTEYPEFADTLKEAADTSYAANIMLALDGRWEEYAFDAGFDEYVVLPDGDRALCRRIDRMIKIKSALREAKEQTWMAFAYRNAALSESLFVFEIDMDTNRATILKTSEEAKKNYYPLDCYSSCEESRIYYHPDDWPLIEGTFKADNLRRYTESGKNEITLNYRIKSLRGTFDWVEAKLHFVKDAYGKPCAFSYVKLIDNQRREKAVLDRILRDEIDEIISIDIKDEWFTCIYSSFCQKPVSDSYSMFFIENIKRFADPSEIAELSEKLSIGHMKAALENNDSMVLSYWTADGGSGRRHKKATAFYGDMKTDIILVTRDITDMTLEEQKHQQELEIALTAAQQASAAKTNFLSRMSHEIRTPMNAIIGMNTLAAQAIGDDERVSECLSKIGISAHYLLSLINDILDMSRIESGKMLLKNEKFYFNDLIAGINAIIYNQTKAKGLDYECRVDNNVSEVYIGDALKLQQILVNVLGNSVKFTSRGSVTLSVEQVSRNGVHDMVRFRINDTGIGISSANLRRIFEPFEQVDTSTTSTYGGTGLGLAITKSLIDIMGGSIHVRSILGAGSEFTIELPLTVDRTEAVTVSPDYRFDRLNTLIVDDDLITCERTSDILREIGMTAEWVTSGSEAIANVEMHFSGGRYYDFILIDWKMPDMDGIETTRSIRRIIGPDVTIIIISAYDWEGIESEARAAGANMLVTKPLFKSTLVSAFKRALGDEEEQKPRKHEFDFSGKRILVAEDNQINAEIAKALLESKNFKVDVASNGLRAMEMFVQKPVGYYDAILMDVRMPQMDGLLATQSIRHWNKEDAKTIPIIAMTANAFDEDIEKSKAAGMNAHLSKPIDPDVLYSTLFRLTGGLE